MSLIKKFLNLFKRNKNVEVEQQEVVKVNEIQPEKETKAVEGVVEAEQETKTAKTVSVNTGVANYFDFAEIAQEKYAEKRKRMQIKRDDLTEKIAKAEDSKAATDDAYLANLAEKDIQSNKQERAKISNLLTVKEQEYAEVMLHKSNISYLNMIQRKLAKLKKQERDALSNCSTEAREMAKGCHPILPFNAEETVVALEGKVATEEDTKSL